MLFWLDDSVLNHELIILSVGSIDFHLIDLLLDFEVVKSCKSFADPYSLLG